MRKTIEINAKGEAETVEHACVEKHECKHNLVIIRNDSIRIYHGDYHTDVKFIRVDIDCSCEVSQPIPFAQFYESPIMSAEENFKGWFCQCAPWFIQNDYKIIDKREENCSDAN